MKPSLLLFSALFSWSAFAQSTGSQASQGPAVVSGTFGGGGVQAESGAALRTDSANGGVPASAIPTKKERLAYIGFSPLHLLITTAALTAEVNLGRNVSLGAIGYLGSISFNQVAASTQSSLKSDSRFFAWGVGGQVNYYFLGNFERGLRVGAQAQYVGVSFSGDVSDGLRAEAIRGAAAGFAPGAYVGGKWTTPIGFTVNADVGAQYIFASAAANSATESASATSNRASLLVNLNAGWTF